MDGKTDVLIVEDEALFAVMISEFLKDEYKISCAYTASGEDAVRIAESRQPDLVFMDIRLAGRMDGIEAAEIIRKKSKAPIIFMTAYGGDTTRERTRNVNKSEFLVKPVDMQTIQKIVRKYCAVNR
jgi:CheY-like chemotaxis protein